MNQQMVDQVEEALSSFIRWLEAFGEVSYDHQSFFAGRLGRAAKRLYYRRPLAGTVAVAPMVLSEALLPVGRRLFWRPQRFPIADAHYAMGFAFLHQAQGQACWLERSLHFLDVLEETRSADYWGWGYPFDWETRYGTIRAGTPMITTLPYVYEAFREVDEIESSPRRRSILRRIADHALHDYQEFPLSEELASCAYFPGDPRAGVINASAYRAFVLLQASRDFSEDGYARAALRNLEFVLQSQLPSGAWPYASDSIRDFVDHFHTCFVLKALAKAERLIDHPGCTAAIQQGVGYYVEHLFDGRLLPKPFSKAPRLTVYRRELYDYAECVNLAILLQGRFPELDARLERVVDDLLRRWRKSDGSFRSRRLRVGWDNLPMHRWAQAQLFRSLALLLRQFERSPSMSGAPGGLQAVASR